MSATPSTEDVKASKQIEQSYVDFLVGIEETFVKAEDMLGLTQGTLADAKNDNGFLAVMKMSSTIEPLINDALEVEIRKLRKNKTESESEAALAAFGSSANFSATNQEMAIEAVFDGHACVPANVEGLIGTSSSIIMISGEKRRMLSGCCQVSPKAFSQ